MKTFSELLDDMKRLKAINADLLAACEAAYQFVLNAPEFPFPLLGDAEELQYKLSNAITKAKEAR